MELSVNAFGSGSQRSWPITPPSESFQVLTRTLRWNETFWQKIPSVFERPHLEVTSRSCLAAPLCFTLRHLSTEVRGTWHSPIVWDTADQLWWFRSENQKQLYKKRAVFWAIPPDRGFTTGTDLPHSAPLYKRTSRTSALSSSKPTSNSSNTILSAFSPLT